MAAQTPAANRGRPRAFDRDLAIKTALDLFLERGYEGASVSELVDAMQIAPTSLYAAFGSKENLYREAIELYLEGRGRFVSRALQREAPVQAQIRHMLEDAAKAFTPGGEEAPGCLVSAGMLVCNPDNHSIAAHVRQLRAAPLAAVVQRIEQARKREELPASVNSKALARFYAAIVTGMAVQARDGAKRRELLDVVECAMQAWPATSHVKTSAASEPVSKPKG